ncbi:MAG: AbrB/MazE/SpoVT family DNA-binding domain-containing protein [Streptosporangiales bacterium]|nr:AbrB/MazE/SpoVT family DNA-binding domain-containing protein [Streptosporangiales bacterium]
MDYMARLTSKGQITIPKAVREALELSEGDQVMFRVEGDQARLTRVPDFFELKGSVPVPPEVLGLSWGEIRELAWTLPDPDEDEEPG